MPLVQWTGPRNPEENPEGFVNKVREKYAGVTNDDIQTLYTRAVMLAQPPVGSIALFGRDICSEHVESLPWWKLLNERHKKLILSHPIDTGLQVEGVRTVNNALGVAGGRSAISRSSLISIDGLENTYIWCKMNSWVQDVEPHDFNLILRQEGDTGRRLRRNLRLIDEHGLYGYVRPFGNAYVRERYTARTVEDIDRLFKEHSSKDLYGGYDAKE